MSDNTVRKTSNDNRRVQTIMFVRHGVAKHNLRDPNTNLPLNLHDPSLLDPSLVLQGKQQALEAGDLIRQWFHTQNLDIELVITSPLTRCLQTTSLAFLPGEEYCFDRQEPKIMVMDQIREAYGMHYPDKRRDKSLLMSQWPKLEWDTQMTEVDEDWKADERETLNDITNRTAQFLEWISSRNEKNIVVVSHGVWIECCLQAFCPSALENGQRVHNCDLFAGHLVSSTTDGKFEGLQNVRLAYNRNWK